MQEAFADLISADPDLVRAEFDAIIEANWGWAEPPALTDIDMAHESTFPARVGPRPPEGTRYPKVAPTHASGLARLRSPPE